MLRSDRQQRRAVLRHHLFVRGDYVPPGRERAFNVLTCRVLAAHQLDDDLHIAIRQHLVDAGREMCVA